MTLLAIVLIALGAGFVLLAAIGLIRLADPLQRMHAATKAGTLGTALILFGTIALKAGETGTALLTILFLLLTLPLGAQLLGRGAYLSGTDLSGLDRPDPLAAALEEEKKKR